MNINTRCTIERAIGIIEGVSYAAADNIRDCLLNVCEMLDAVLADEERRKTDDN